MQIDLKDKVLGIRSLIYSVVTAAIPVIKYSTGDSDDILSPQEIGQLIEMFEVIRTTDEFTDILMRLGLDPYNERDLAIVMGAFQTALFVVVSATATGDDPEEVWQWYLNSN